MIKFYDVPGLLFNLFVFTPIVFESSLTLLGFLTKNYFVTFKLELLDLFIINFTIFNNQKKYTHIPVSKL